MGTRAQKTNDLLRHVRESLDIYENLTRHTAQIKFVVFVFILVKTQKLNTGFLRKNELTNTL